MQIYCPIMHGDEPTQMVMKWQSFTTEDDGRPVAVTSAYSCPVCDGVIHMNQKLGTLSYDTLDTRKRPVVMRSKAGSMIFRVPELKGVEFE